MYNHFTSSLKSVHSVSCDPLECELLKMHMSATRNAQRWLRHLHFNIQSCWKLRIEDVKGSAIHRLFHRMQWQWPNICPVCIVWPLAFRRLRVTYFSLCLPCCDSFPLFKISTTVSSISMSRCFLGPRFLRWKLIALHLGELFRIKYYCRPFCHGIFAQSCNEEDNDVCELHGVDNIMDECKYNGWSNYSTVST